MIESIFNFFEKLITSFSWRRLVFVISTLGLFIAALVVFEVYTGHFRLNRIDRATTALQHLTEISPRIKDSEDKDLIDISESIQNDLKNYVDKTTTPFNIPPKALKVIAASVPWLLLILMFALNKDGGKMAVVGVFMISPVFITIAYFLPSFDRPWLSYIVYPISLFAIPVLSITLFHKKKS